MSRELVSGGEMTGQVGSSERNGIYGYGKADIKTLYNSILMSISEQKRCIVQSEKLQGHRELKKAQ